jgi:hypothetical protein
MHRTRRFEHTASSHTADLLTTLLVATSPPANAVNPQLGKGFTHQRSINFGLAGASRPSGARTRNSALSICVGQDRDSMSPKAPVAARMMLTIRASTMMPKAT